MACWFHLHMIPPTWNILKNMEQCSKSGGKWVARFQRRTVIQEQYFCALDGNLYYPTQFFLLIPNVGTIFTQAHVPIQKFNFFWMWFLLKNCTISTPFEVLQMLLLHHWFLFFVIFGLFWGLYWEMTDTIKFSKLKSINWCRFHENPNWSRWTCIQNAPRNNSSKLKFWKFNITRRSKKEQTVFCR